MCKKLCGDLARIVSSEMVWYSLIALIFYLLFVCVLKCLSAHHFRRNKKFQNQQKKKIIRRTEEMYLFGVIPLYQKKIYEYEKSANQGTQDQSENLLPAILSCFFKFLSLDYVITAEQKKKLTNRDQRAAFISSQNHVNFGLSLAVIVALGCLFCFAECKILLGVASCFVMIRTWSRTMEINISFLEDVISGFPTRSSLSPSERFKLALISLFEEAILFSGVYTIICKKISWKAMFWGFHSLVVSSPEFCETAPTILDVIAWYQILCTTLLISIALASYIGGISSRN